MVDSEKEKEREGGGGERGGEREREGERERGREREGERGRKRESKSKYQLGHFQVESFYKAGERINSWDNLRLTDNIFFTHSNIIINTLLQA